MSLRYYSYSQGEPPFVISAENSDRFMQSFGRFCFSLEKPQEYYDFYIEQNLPHLEKRPFGSTQEFIDFLLEQGILIPPNPAIKTGPK